MHGPDRRRFTITDAMVLIAATALGMAWIRAVYPDSLRPPPRNYVGWLLQGPPTCLTTSLALALIILRWRRPRPRRRRLVIQPGFVASVASLAALLLGLGCGLFFWAVNHPERGYAYQLNIQWSWGIGPCPGFVLGAWLGLWLAGLWAPERSWIDRAGRALGLFWITDVAWPLVGSILAYLFPRL
jgi:hypothetical protein